MVFEAGFVAERLLEEPVFLQQPAVFETVCHQDLELLDVEGLGQVIQGPQAQGLDGLLHAGVGRDHDRRDRGLGFLEMPEDIHAVDLGHLDVADQEIDILLLDVLVDAGRARIGQDVIPFFLQNDGQKLDNRPLVIDNENRVHRRPTSVPASPGWGISR